MALAGCVCASLPQSELWRLAGFGQVAAVLAEVAPASADVHLTLPLDLAFSLADERNLPILGSAVTAYNTVLNRNFISETLSQLPLTDRDFFTVLNLDFRGWKAVKAAVLADNIAAAISEYTAFRHQFLKDFVGGICNPDSVLLERSDTYTTAKTYLECLLRLSIYPTPAIQATTEMGIAACLFPEFRHSAQVLILALRRYRWVVDAFFHTDGFHKDRTLRAHVEAIADFTRFLSVYSVTEGANTDGTAERVSYLKEALEKQVAACIQLSRPNFSFPSVGCLACPELQCD